MGWQAKLRGWLPTLVCQDQRPAINFGLYHQRTQG